MLNTTKRRLTQKPVASTTHIGAPATISGMLANCELPANTNKVMLTHSTRLRPDFIMATPVIRPHAAIPKETGKASRTPWVNSACFHRAVGGVFAAVSCSAAWVGLRKKLPHLQRKTVQKVCCSQALATGALQLGQF